MLALNSDSSDLFSLVNAKRARYLGHLLDRGAVTTNHAAGNDYTPRLCKSRASSYVVSRPLIAPIGYGASVNDDQVDLFTKGPKTPSRLNKRFNDLVGFVLVELATERLDGESFIHRKQFFLLTERNRRRIRIIRHFRSASFALRYHSTFALFTDSGSIRSVGENTAITNAVAIHWLSGELSRFALA